MCNKRQTVGRVVADRTARRRVDIVRVVLTDETGAIEAVWFNQRYLVKVLAEGMRLSVRGTYRPQGGRSSFVVKSHEILEEEEGDSVHTEGIVPVYPASEQVSARLLRGLLRAVRPAMRRLPDPLPAALREREGLPTRADATLAVHLPRDLDEAGVARARLVLEELLLMQVGLLLHKGEQQRRAAAPALAKPSDLSQAFLEGLPFELTAHQLQALVELDADLARTVPMRRLLQGDVGSGKTVVALYCLVRAAEAGFQGALMAPTETLAIQHAETAARLAGGLAPTELLTAALTAKERRAALERIASGAARLVIGTHALLQEDVEFAGLALLVVDEQHRFGVEQRDALVRRAERGGRAPHVLHMTATPIPRTLALTVYGDLDVTIIAGSPAGRHASRGRRAARGGLRVRAQAGRQRTPGLRGVPCHRRVGVDLGGHGPGRGRAPAGGALSRVSRGRGARSAQIGRPRRRHARLQGWRRAGPGLDEPDRGRHRRAQRLRDDRRGRRALRPRSAAPAARARGEGDGQVVLSALLAGRDRRLAGAARGPARDQRRFRAGRPRSRDPRRGPGDGRAPGGRAGPQARPLGARSGGAASRPRARHGDHPRRPRPQRPRQRAAARRRRRRLRPRARLAAQGLTGRAAALPYTVDMRTPELIATHTNTDFLSLIHI